jgi:TonB family protein
MRLLISLLGFSAVLHAQTGDAVYRAGGGISAPQVIFKVDPEYTEIARSLMVTGTVVARLIVQADGSADNITVTRPVGYGLDQKAVDAIASWKFRPGEKAGQPVAVIVTIEINFRLLDPVDGLPKWRPGPMAFRLRPDITRVAGPVLISASPPDVPPASEADGAVFEVNFDVNESGVPRNFQIVKSSGFAVDNAILSSIQNWRFSPAMQAGKPIAVSGSLEFHRK